MGLDRLPDNLPVPLDDGAADHLESAEFPEVSFAATNGESVTIRNLAGRVVLYVYPMTGRPGTPLPDGWDEIPGARGCTPQSCGFRDHYRELRELDASVYGLSVQETEYQREAKERLHLPFELLSDADLVLRDLLRLPTFEAAGMELYKRITLILRRGTIEKVFYPVFPPDENADRVLAWLRSQR